MIGAGNQPEESLGYPREERIRGIGQAVRESIHNYKDLGKPWHEGGVPSAGNDTGMRAAPVGLGHLTGDPDHDYFVSEAEIRAAGVQYCALGHWHKVAEYFPGNPFRAWFCGSPPPWACLACGYRESD